MIPGLWEIPLNSHYNNEASGGQCTYLDQCVFTYQSSENVLQWLKEDFLRYHTVRGMAKASNSQEYLSQLSSILSDK